MFTTLRPQIFLIFFAALATAFSMPSAAAASEPQPWACLTTVRDSAFHEVTEADFVQDFLPAGFSSGDRESGVMVLGLPRCFRWDYRTPFSRSYLLCENEVYTWNQGEASGRHLTLDGDSEPGLDLLRLEVDTLRQRYRITSMTASEVGWSLDLEPLAAGPVSSAELLVDRGCNRLVGLLHRDVEGNETRFRFSGFRPANDADPFAPPRDLNWLED